MHAAGNTAKALSKHPHLLVVILVFSTWNALSSATLHSIRYPWCVFSPLSFSNSICFLIKFTRTYTVHTWATDDLLNLHESEEIKCMFLLSSSAQPLLDICITCIHSVSLYVYILWTKAEQLWKTSDFHCVQWFRWFNAKI